MERNRKVSVFQMDGGNEEMRKEDLNQRQIDLLEGRICPYCKQPAEMIDGRKRLKRGDLHEIMWCGKCKAWSNIMDGKPEGRICSPDERKKRDIVEEELGRLVHSLEDEDELRKSLAIHLGCPEEYADVRHVGVTSFPKILQFCMMNADKSGSKIRWRKPGDECDEERTKFMVGASACRGCPHFLIEDDEYVWCDVDFVYGKLRKKSI